MTFDLEQGMELKESGMQLAASRRKESLAACRSHLVKLAQRGDGTCTADDAAQYVEFMRLEPLGNAAGALFAGKWWKMTGEYRPSARKTNHTHRNPIWILVPEFLPNE
jgi:hypothetical protein